MIYFDTTRAFGTVSYYLWKLYSGNRPDYTVQTDVQFTPDAMGPITGAVGVGTWGTSAEFKDIRVEKNGAALFSSDFTKGDAGWNAESGNWSVVDGAYRQSDDANGLSYIGDETWSDYTVTLKARKLHGAEGFLIVFGRKGGDKYWWNVGGWGNHEHAIEFNQNSVGQHANGSVETGRWYDIKIELTGRQIRCYMDGNLVHDVTASSADRFLANAGRDEATGEIVVKAINTSAQGVKADMNILGVGGVASKAEVTVLSSAKLSDNNTLDDPQRIVPVNHEMEISGPKFDVEIPAMSLMVLRVKTK
jgi:alpha-L-arabinofuranosidase